MSSKPAQTTALTFRRFEDGDSEHRPWQEEIFKAGWSHKCPTYVHRTPACQGSCPSGHDIRGWLDIARGIDKPKDGMAWQEMAFRRMTDANPFPAIMGRVCPAPCEKGCNRNAVDDHIGINAIEQYVGDWAIKNGLKFPKPAVETGKKVAVIGGGPAGLSAAYHLRRKGHSVVIFDDHEQLGGMMRYGIPGYRTPRDVLDAEVGRILDMGVEARLKTRIGRDITIEQLKEQFDAVFWGLGTHVGRALPVAGAEAPNCISGVAFLRAFNEGRLKHVPGRIVVVGGGDTSIDVASVARRLGKVDGAPEEQSVERVIIDQIAHDVAHTARRDGTDVTLTSLFTVDKMFASPREIEDAMREGVDIQGGIMPLEVVRRPDGRARALKMCKCTMNGMTPVPIEGTEFEIECELIVAAIGQKGDLAELAELDNGRGFIDADKMYQVAKREGEFTGGDIVRPHLLTTAIGHGRVAAEGMDAFLHGQPVAKRPKVDVVQFKLLDKLRANGIEPDPFTPDFVRGTSAAKFAVHNYEDRSASEIIKHDGMFLGHFPYTTRHHRGEVKIEADEVLGNFQERLIGYSDEQAVAEAKRCMSCGLCFECDNCVVFCPQTAVQRVPRAERALGRYVYTEYSKCIGCHICHDVCPTGYIQMGLGE